MRITATIGLVLLAQAARAAVYTAGPAGTHPLIQNAVNTAVFAGGSNEVRVQAGTLAQRIIVDTGLAAAESLTITGGWDATFTERVTDPGATILDAGGSARALEARPGGGTLWVEGFTFRNGQHPILGGGVQLHLTANGGQVTFTNNVVEGSRSEDGGGIYARIDEQGGIVVTNNVIRDNVATLRGAGLSVRALGLGVFTVRDNQIEGNQIECCPTLNGNPQTGSGTGVFVKLQEAPSVDFSDNLIRGNESTGTGNVLGDGGALWIFPGCGALECTNATLTARRNLWLDNLNSTTGEFQDHVNLLADPGASPLSSTLFFTDSVVSGGDHVGVAFITRPASTIRLTNLTVVDHPAAGIEERGIGGITTLHNTIAFGNSPDLDIGSVGTGTNLVGVDPLFVDAAGGDLGLAEGSPGIDTGNNDPPGGLGPFDVEGGPRVVDDIVNIGALERVPEPAALWMQASALFVLATAARRARRATRVRAPGGCAGAIRAGAARPE